LWGASGSPGITRYVEGLVSRLYGEEREEGYLHDDELGQTVAELVIVPADAHFNDKLERLFPDDAVFLELDKRGDPLCGGIVEFRRGISGPVCRKIAGRVMGGVTVGGRGQ